MTTQSKLRIQQALNHLQQGDLGENGLALLAALGYDSDRRLELDNQPAAFLASFGDENFRPDKALFADWQSAEVLCQITDSEIVQSNQLAIFDSAGKVVEKAIIESYLFVAIELAGAHYTRTQLAQVTREINKLFPMPAMLLFRHGPTLTLSIINRRLHKRDQSKDVLEKVTLIKDIRLADPHRAHIEILFDLSLPELYRIHGFSNFVELHKAWQKTLDSSELNKRFFSEIANWYFWAVNQVTFPPAAGPEETRNATSVIRLITRLIFVWFLKEKGLVPDELFTRRALDDLLAWDDPQDSTYYKAVLQNLFFATLNQEMNTPAKPDNRKFRGKRDSGQDQHFMIHNVYRYERYFRDPAQALDLFTGIPFLNGGLFECLDRRVDGQDIRVDGFSDRADNPLRVPDELFWGGERTVDLNTIYGTSGKSYRVRGLIHTLNRYKFTITENTPIEEEIALDPELLGKVFENLLAAYNPETGTTARKQTGSFYTPREIVNYMVDESLLAYLEAKLAEPDLAGLQDLRGLNDRLRHLFAYNEEPYQFDAVETDRLIEAIDHINILDPACGSGAFPMGILHRLVFILAKLDPNNARWKEQQIAPIRQAIADAKAIPDGQVRAKVIADLEQKIDEIEEAFNRNELDYGRKLYLIENCIYGVDIQPIAVQIAKLRFFISLVVDQRIDDTAANRGVLPLPNLETKFVAANTLIGIEKPAQMALRNPAIDERERELGEVRSKHFRARTPLTKEKWRLEDQRLRVEMGELLRLDGFPNETTRKLISWDPYDQNTSASFFDPEWMFGVENGFDVVIGNPPYLRVQGIQQTQPDFMPYYRRNFQSASGSFDLYVLFIERGYQLLGKSGQFAYIVPHKFLQAAFGQSLRRLLTEHRALRQIVRFGSAQVFEEATTYTCLLFLSAEPNDHFDLLEVETLARSDEVFQAARGRESHPDYVFDRQTAPTLPKSESEAFDWNFAVGKHDRILRRLRQHPKVLGDITRKIFQGLATSADKIYVLELREERNDTVVCFSRHLGSEVEIERGLVKPFLMGKDVHRYEPPTARNVVIFPYLLRNGQGELMSEAYIKRHFPLGWQYLEINRHDLGERERGRMHGSEFYAYIYPKNLTEFDAMKILTPEIALGGQMTLDSAGGLYHTTKVYSIVPESGLEYSERYLLGLLNSRLLWYFLSNTGYVLRGGYYTFKTNYLSPFPIAPSSVDQRHVIETLVDYVLFLKAQVQPEKRKDAADWRVMVAYFEQLVDAIVYEMYFPEELEDADNLPSKLLMLEQLPSVNELDGRRIDFLLGLFRRLYAPDHPVRSLLFFLDRIETIRTIEESSWTP